MNVLDIVLVIAGVGFVLARRTAGELLEMKRLLILPVVLTAVGLSSLGKLHHPTPGAVAYVAVGVAVTVGLGLLRGATVHLGVRDGQLWMRYRASTLVLWVATLAARAGLAVGAHAVSPSVASASTKSLLFSVGIGILAESAVVLLRAMRTDAASTQVVWSKGKDGAPHQSSPAFERARKWMNAEPGVDLRKRVRLPERDW